MKLKKKKSLIIFMILMLMICTFGIFADKNFIRYELYGEMTSNYEFSTSDTNDYQLAYSVNFPLKGTMVDLNGYIRSLLGQREMNGVTKLNNGYLTLLCPKADEALIQADADAITAFSQYAETHGTKVLYVQPAYQISQYDPQLPEGDVDYSNANIDLLLSKIEPTGINVLDLREQMHDEGMNQYDYYYHTDHHWTTEGGFWAYTEIAKWIEQNTGVKADAALTDLNNYQINQYQNWHLSAIWRTAVLDHMMTWWSNGMFFRIVIHIIAIHMILL